jgi:sodium transport system ATP-binding protein
MPHPVEIEDLTKTFGARRAVDGLNLHVKAGEIYGLLGPNGAGKTTALRMVSGLLTPTGGRVLVGGLEVARAPEAVKAGLGFLTGSTGLYSRLSVREVLMFFGRVHGLDKGAVTRRVSEVATALAIEPLLDRRCESLSSGEKQRVSIARTVLHDPPVLVLDEPTSGLDVLASRFLRDLVRAERARGRAVLFSTHYLAEAELLCDRVGLLFRGRLLREGAPSELRRQAGASSLEEAFLSWVEALEGAAAADPERPFSAPS